MVYQWKTQGLYKVDPDIAGREIEQCKDESGYIRPSAVVERAKPENSALHGCFEWDDTKAAQGWRESQARALVRNLVTIVVNKNDGIKEPDHIRAFIHITDETDRGYKPITAVIQSSTDTAYMLEQAKRELQCFKQKYSLLSELTSVFLAIEEVVV